MGRPCISRDDLTEAEIRKLEVAKKASALYYEINRDKIALKYYLKKYPTAVGKSRENAILKILMLQQALNLPIGLPGDEF
jgi:hypothetical protein